MIHESKTNFTPQTTPQIAPVGGREYPGIASIHEEVIGVTVGAMIGDDDGGGDENKDGGEEDSNGNDKKTIHELHNNNEKLRRKRSISGSLPVEDITDLMDSSMSGSEDNYHNSGSVSGRRTTYFRNHRASSLWMPREVNDDTDSMEKVNAKALQVLQRVSTKLKGRDVFVNSAQTQAAREKENSEEYTEVSEQVQRLLVEATDHHNLAQAYLGWCPLW
jgi:hypothetical protein